MKLSLNFKSIGLAVALTATVILLSAKIASANDGYEQPDKFWGSGSYTECIGGIAVYHCTYHVFWIKTKDKVCGNGSC